MTCGKANWELLTVAAHALVNSGRSPFSRGDLIREVQRGHPERPNNSLNPTIQGMIVNTYGGPSSASGKIFFKVDRGLYELYDPSRHGDIAGMPSLSMTRRRGKSAELEARIRALTTDFGRFVQVYDDKVPFLREGQWELHKRTIERRLELGSVTAAIEDREFRHLLRETLKRWGIGRRASRLTDESTFNDGIRSFATDLTT